MFSIAANSKVRITADPSYLRFGLFGNVLLYVFRLLPYLESRNIYPQWEIAAELYGPDPDRVVIPGLFELAYSPPTTVDRVVPIQSLYKWRQSYLGSDFPALSTLWKRYFKVPGRIEAAADRIGPLSEVLGVHYRGNEKLTSTWDSNYISPDDFLVLVSDFLRSRPDIKRVLVVTDDQAFSDRVAATIKPPIITREPGRFLFEEKSSDHRVEEADKALLDCVLLSRCKSVMSTSSALSAFAKVLRPELEIYRCAASKLFEDSPYWPVAYIPVYKPSDAAALAVLNDAMQGDWTATPRYSAFSQPFAYRKRSFRAHVAHRLWGRLGRLPVQVFMRAQQKEARSGQSL